MSDATHDAVELALYSRAGCHLCERARDELEYAREHDAGVSFVEYDIDGDPALRERYRTTIPVVALGVREIAWPFRAREVLAMVRAHREERAADAAR